MANRRQASEARQEESRQQQERLLGNLLQNATHMREMLGQRGSSEGSDGRVGSSEDGRDSKEENARSGRVQELEKELEKARMVEDQLRKRVAVQREGLRRHREVSCGRRG